MHSTGKCHVLIDESQMTRASMCYIKTLYGSQKVDNVIHVYGVIWAKLLSVISDATAAVYPPNWATLKSPATSQKIDGQVAKNWATFHPSIHSSPFSSSLPVSCQFREFLIFFQCPRTFFSLISGIKTSWRAINFSYPLHVGVNNLIVFPPNRVILIILRRKSTQIWEIGRTIT